MKRLMTGITACALIIASCAKQEITESVLDGQGQLTFSTGLGKQSTKAAEMMNSSLKTAAATNGVVIHAYQNSGTWDKWFEDEVIYDLSWKLKNSTRFRNAYPTKYITYFSTVANALTADFTSVDFTSGKFPKFDYTVAGNSVTQEDLIAGITEAAASQADITLGMRHILSQVNFGTVGYKGVNIAIQNIRVEGLFNSATFTYNAEDKYPIGKWTAHGTDGTDGERKASYNYLDYSNTVIPQNPQPLVLDTATKGDVYIFGDGGNWGPGKASTVLYPAGTDGAWVKGDQTLPNQLENSLIVMPQDFTNTPDAKVIFEYKITDVNNGHVAGTPDKWEQGEFKLDFSKGTTSGLDYNAKWESNYRYVYLIDFTDFLDGIALTFKVNVEMYPWENHNNGGSDNGIINIMAAGQPSAANMNDTEFINGDTWYIATQSETAPTRANWAQVIKNETWDLSAYDFTQIATSQTFSLNFQHVIFNTAGTAKDATTIRMTLPDGFLATVANTPNIKVEAHTSPNTWEISLGDTSVNAAVTITNNSYYRTPAALETGVEAAGVTNGAKFGYGGTEAVDLTAIMPAGLNAGETVTVKFNSLVTPKTSGSNWTWDAGSQTATYTQPQP